MVVIIILILLGILLFVIEFLLVPGVTVAGIGGLVLTVFGVYKSFNDYGPAVGAWVLIGTILMSVFVIAMSLRARTWNRLMLKTDIHSTVDTALTEQQVKPGDRGSGKGSQIHGRIYQRKHPCRNYFGRGYKNKC
jgi:membrane-bound ClpP family serine protease